MDDLELQALRKALTRMQDEQIPQGPLRKLIAKFRDLFRPRQRKTIAHIDNKTPKPKNAA